LLSKQHVCMREPDFWFFWTQIIFHSNIFETCWHDYTSIKLLQCSPTLSLSTVFCEVREAMEIVSGWLLASPWLSASSVVSLKDQINTINLISNMITYTILTRSPIRKGIRAVYFGSTAELVLLIQIREESEQGIKDTSCWCCAAWLGFWEGVWAPLAPPSGGPFSPESPPWCFGSTPVSLLYWRPSGGRDDVLRDGEEKMHDFRSEIWTCIT